MALNTKGILLALMDRASTSGLFEAVNGHEAKSAPGNGLSAEVYVAGLKPIPGRSGLASTTMLLTAIIRVRTNMLSEPADDIDPTIMGAVDALFAALSGDFDLGNLVQEVDLLGAHGTPLSGKAGYIPQDNKLFRCFDITVPLIINDVYDQGA